MATPFEISDRFTDEWAALAPIAATRLGISGHDHECGDFSPEGVAERTHLYRRIKEALNGHLDHQDPIQSFAARVLSDWLTERIGKFEAHEWRRDLNHIASPFQYMRDVFDVMRKDRPEHWDPIVARLAGYAGMLAGYRECLEEGLAAGDTVAVRQAESVLEQAEAAASEKSRFIS
jgi:uncharacterized protein (DUF885 family)